MPNYRLRKVPKKDLYWVVGPDGKHHSKEGMPRKTALAQKRILEKAVLLEGGADCKLDNTECAEVNGTYFKGTCYNAPDVACGVTPEPEPVSPAPTPLPIPIPTPQNPAEKIPENSSVRSVEIPSLYTFWRMSINAKKPEPIRVIDGWHLDSYTNDLKFYVKGNVGIVAVRGTNKAEDWEANSLIPFNKAIGTTRVQRDINQMKTERSRLAKIASEWYGVGHSLGGAICDIFIDKGLIREAVSFNPAIESRFANSDKNHRYYHADDPLYYFLGRNAKIAGVIPGQDYSWHDWASWVLPWTDIDYGALWAHKIERFEEFTRTKGSAPAFGPSNADIYEPGEQRRGRGRTTDKPPPPKLARHLKQLNIDPKQYLEEARRKAKAAGLASEGLSWARDGTHKFQISDAEGKVTRFGAAGMGDYILYKMLKDPSANKHRKAYRARATKIPGDWQSSPYSANSLAIHILW